MNRRSLRPVRGLLLASVMLSMAACAAGQNLRVVFGNLHAHSNASDGNPDISPAKAYKIARDDGKLDFLCLSEHNHIMKDQAVYDGVMQAAAAATTTSFVALYGQEFSTIKKGHNHANIQNYPVQIPETLNGMYAEVFGALLPNFVADNRDTIVFGEFNHPDNINTDYGLEADFGGDFDSFVNTMDEFVRLIAVASGPADADKKDFIPASNKRFVHQNISIGRWFDYLSRGMHLAPKIDEDTHSPTYGFRHAGRTAVWIRGDFTRDTLLDALNRRHCYATEDKNLRVIPTLTGTQLPGDILTGQGDNDLAVTLHISDDDEPAAKYDVEVFSGIVKSGTNATRVASLDNHRDGDGDVTFQLDCETDVSLYYVVHIKQSSPDPVNGSTVDDAWLAPIWIDGTVRAVIPGTDDLPEEPMFVGSRNSKKYHFPDCRAVKAIKPENLVTYSEKPEGKELHKGCPQH